MTNHSTGTSLNLHIRAATLNDVPTIHAIYSHNVLTGTASWEYDPPSLDEMRARMCAILEKGYPYFVAESEGRIAGYTYASSYRPRIGYRFTVEDSVYVLDDFHGRGVGRALLNTLIGACSAKGYKQMVAVIGDSANVASIKLHRAVGFTHAATMPNIGYKFERWLDSVLMQRAL